MDNKSILLIGNGPSAINYEAGKIVDNFQSVCRFNWVKIEGYEKYVGIKCDIWVTCVTEPYLKLRQHMFKKIYFPLTQKHYIELTKIIPNSECFPPRIYEITSKINGKYFYPSSGLLAAMFFIDLHYEVFLYGFDFFQEKKHHYGDNQTIGPHHSPEMELLAFSKLLKENKVKLLIS